MIFLEVKMSKELAKNYDPSIVEDRIYQNWLDKGYFLRRGGQD